MTRKNFPFLTICSLIIVGLATTITISVLQKNKIIPASTNNFILSLKAGETKSFPNKQIKITLKQIVLPLVGQKDGLTQVNILLERNGQSEELIYKIGGFAGFDVREQKFSSGTIKLEEIKPDQVKLNISFNE